MIKPIRLLLSTLVAGAAQLAAAAVYHPGDLLLVFRDGSNPDVEYNLGSVSNLVNQSAGSPVSISYDISGVTANFGGSLSGVSYAVVAVTKVGDTVSRAWVTDGSGSAPSGYLSTGGFSSVRGVINGIGSSAAASLGSAAFPFVDSPADTASYDYIASGGTGLYVDSLGGNLPFSVEAVGPSTTLPLYELVPSTLSPIPAARQLGNFQMASDGSLTYTPGTVAPVITATAHNASGTRGGSASFSGAAYNAASYQWYHNGVAVAGATGGTLNLSNISAQDSGTYTLVATSPQGTTSTTSATLAVTPAYSSTDLILVLRDGSNPDVEYNLGSVSNYMNRAAGTPIAISYDISGATANFGGSLSGVSYAVVAATKIGDSVSRAWVTDGSGSAPSGYLSTGGFSSVRGVINGIGSSAGAANGGIWPFVDSPADTASYDYIASGGTGLYVDSLGGNLPFSVEAVGPMTSLPLYELVPSTLSPIPAATRLGDFQMASDGSLSFTPVAVTPTITANPIVNTNLAYGNSTTLTVRGYNGNSYQWYHNGVAISGATGASYTVANATPASAGNYYARIYDSAYGTFATSTTAHVGKVPPYASTELLLVFRDGSNPDVEFNLGSVSNYLNIASGGSLPISYDIAGVTANFGGSLSGVSYALVAATKVGDTASRVWLTDGDAASAPNGGGYISSGGFSTLRGIVNGIGSSAGAADGGIWPFYDSPTDTASYDYIASAGTGSYVDSLGGNSPFSVEAVGPNTFIPFVQLVPASQAPAAAFSVVGVLTMANDGSLTLSNTAVSPLITASSLADRTVNAGTATTFSVTASYASSYQWFKDGSAISGATGSTLTLNNPTSAKNGSYSVVISNALFHTSTTSASSALTVIDPPVITSNPASLTNNAGTTATFTVAYTGTSPSIQWYKGGSAISGETAATLTLNNVQDSDVADYTVVLTNAAGSVTSSPAAHLTVIDPPVIGVGPASRTNIYNTTATFSVTTSGGTAPFSYAWYHGSSPLSDGGNVSGSTTATLTLTGVADSDAGNYTVQVSNAAGTASATASLTLACPTITLGGLANAYKTNAYSQTIDVLGGTAPYTFSVVSGSLPPRISLNAGSGVVSGTPTNVGYYTFTVGVTDAYGCTGTRSYALTVLPNTTADTAIPTVTMTTPAAGATVSTLNVTLAGTAADNVYVGQVLVNLNNTGFVNATVSHPTPTTTTWTNIGTAIVGTNTVTFKSVDLAGNVSAVGTRSFFYAVGSPLTVNINGTGAVASAAQVSNLGGTNLYVGRRYTLTANPGANFIFSNWINNASSAVITTNVYSFVMQTNLTLTVNFTTNQFIGGAGGYNGLFSEASGATEHSSGFFKATVTAVALKPGTFTSTLFVDGDAFTPSGKFDVGGAANLTIVRKGKANLTLALQLNTDDTITGTVACAAEGWSSALLADHVVFNKTSNPATAYTNSYNIVMPGNAVSGPAGDGYAVVSVDLGGGVKVAGAAGDGQAFGPQTALLSKNGAWPVYAPLYKALYNTGSNNIVSYNGALIGWLNFDPANTTNQVYGNLVWVKTSWTNGYYDSGFTNDSEVAGSVYLAPAVGAREIMITNGTATFAGGNLATATSVSVTISNNNSFTFGTSALKPNKFMLTTLSGVVSGVITNGGVGTKVNSVYLPLQNQIRGYFLGTSQSGNVLIQ